MKQHDRIQIAGRRQLCLSVVVPAYNVRRRCCRNSTGVERGAGQLLSELRNRLRHDGSRDPDTESSLRDAKAADPHVRVYQPI